MRVALETVTLSLLSGAFALACGRSELDLWAPGAETVAPPSEGPDAGAGIDAPSPSDAAAPIEAASPVDAGHPPDAGLDAPATPDACVPATCETVGCGSLPDGCGGTVVCEACPPSCDVAESVPGVTDCGPGGHGTESCCTSLPVPGGTFYRSYDGVSEWYTTPNAPASVSGFRLDKYEVTVGRFRRFVDAVVGGWSPPAASGKHTYLNAGAGLSATDGNETGWDPAWSANLATSASGWNANLTTSPACDASEVTWTTSPGTAGERLPANCIDWYEAYAFCIWDDAFLPSEAEWNYAASGGADQRVYPWSSPPMSSPLDCTLANYGGGTGTVERNGGQGPASCAPGGGANAVGTESPKGNGKWGQTDLEGNVGEWNLDWFFDAYTTPCTDCAFTCTECFGATVSPTRVARGSAFAASPNFPTPGYFPDALITSLRTDSLPVARGQETGVRCARAPTPAPKK